MNVCFYITKNTKVIKNSKKSEIGDLVDGARIFEIDTNLQIINSKDLEGPFFDLKGLIENSIVYKELKKENSKRANKIILKENIFRPIDYILSPKGRKYEFNFIESFSHSVFGTFGEDDVKGIHYFDEAKIRVINIIENNEKGVFRANIEAFDSKSNQWKKKDKPTDFFPITWSKDQLLDELYFANDNKTLKKDTKNVYEGKTKSGINVIFIIVSGKIKTVYPVL